MLKKRNFSIRTVSKYAPEGKRIIQSIYDLRKSEYARLGWVLNPDSAAHMIKDQFDEAPSTTHFAILEEGELIGVHRMTRYTPHFKLPYLEDGYEENLFGVNCQIASEANRLLIKQDKKYPGCAKQLLFNTTKYQLEHYSDIVASIGDEDHIDFFKYIGYDVIDKEVTGVLDEQGDEQVIRKGFPLIATPFSLNQDLGLDKYDIPRDFVVIE